MLFIAIVFGCLGLLSLAGFVTLYMQIGALADELRAGRESDTVYLGEQLDAVADKLQGLRLDADKHRKELAGHGERIKELAIHIEGPPSMRKPIFRPQDPQQQ
ncbi:MAG: hypothetical protein U0441_07130 [Polyangiaceae bacterium]